MSGAKRRTPYRKQVTDSVLYELVEPTDSQKVAVVLRSHGSNILEVQCEGGDVGLAMLPTKFRKLVWVKRGDAVLLSGAEGSFTTSAGTEGRVRYIIDTVLYPDQLKNLRSTGRWPVELDSILGAKAAGTGEDAAAGGAGGSAASAGTGAGAKKGTKASGGAKSAGHGKFGKSEPAKFRGAAGAGGGAALAAAMLAKARYAADDDEGEGETADDTGEDGRAVAHHSAESGDDADATAGHVDAGEDDDDDDDDDAPPTWSRGQGRRDLPPSDDEDDYDDADGEDEATGADNEHSPAAAEADEAAEAAEAAEEAGGAGEAAEAGEAEAAEEAAEAACSDADAAVDELADGVAASSVDADADED